jgi:hypothetical protein
MIKEMQITHNKNMYDYETLKPAKVISRRGRGRRNNNGRDEQHWTILYSFMEMSLQTPL